jgi:hypothetical protein
VSLYATYLQSIEDIPRKWFPFLPAGGCIYLLVMASVILFAVFGVT